MNQILRIIENINCEDDYPTQFQLILSIVLQQNQKNASRPETIKLLETLESVISTDNQLVHKFYSIMIARDLFLRKYTTFVSALSNSKLLQTMLFIAKNTDPEKRIDDKGRHMTNPDLGNDYVTLIIECIIKWSERFPLTSHHSPTKFRLAYQQLVRDKVVLPKQFRFFSNDLNKGMYNEDKRSSQANLTGSNLSQNLNPKAIEGSVRNSAVKIEGFVNFLDQCSDADQLKREIDRYHKLFQQQNQKNQTNMDKILNQQLLDAQSMNMLLGIQEFYHKQNEAYNCFLTQSDDLKSYLDSISISIQQIKGKIQNKTNRSPRFSGSQMSYNASGVIKYPTLSSDRQGRDEKIHYQRRVTDVVSNNRSPQPGRNSYGRVEPALIRDQYSEQSITYIRNNQPKRSTQPMNYGITTNQMNAINNHRSMGNGYQQTYPGYRMNGSSLNRDTQQSVRTSGYFNDKQLTSDAERGNMIIKQMMSRVTTPSKGFGQIKKQLDEERSLSNRSRNPNRSRKSKSPRPMSRYRRHQQQSNFTVSRDISKAEVFEVNNHIKVTKDDYTGSMVNSSNYDLSDMSLDQGWKKFRKANFKHKGILFENEHLQIGYKSQAIYEDLQSFSVFVKIGVYIGNKINDTISKVDVEYEGDQSALMYCTPKRFEETIGANQQVKQDVVVIPLQFPFNLISCVLKYSVKRQSHTVVFYLPNSVLKLSIVQPIAVNKFNEYYQSSKKNEYRSQPFKLSKELAPSTLLKLFENGVALTDLTQFTAQKSYYEYVIGFYFQLLESQDYLCKLIIRPDITAVIQLVVVDATKDSILYGTTLIQTLQLLLQSQKQL